MMMQVLLSHADYSVKTTDIYGICVIVRCVVVGGVIVVVVVYSVYVAVISVVAGVVVFTIFFYVCVVVVGNELSTFCYADVVGEFVLLIASSLLFGVVVIVVIVVNIVIVSDDIMNMFNICCLDRVFAVYGVVIIAVGNDIQYRVFVACCYVVRLLGVVS